MVMGREGAAAVPAPFFFFDKLSNARRLTCGSPRSQGALRTGRAGREVATPEQS